MIYIFSSRNTAALWRALAPDKKNTWVEILQPALSEYSKINSGDQAYLDISGLSPVEMKKTFGLFKKIGAFWGIIDPKGAAEDPALFFFDGACDYIGPALIKNGLSKKRFSAAVSWAFEGGGSGSGTETANDAERDNKKKSPKLPTGKFEGWKSIRNGTSASFFFLFVSLSGKSNLRSQIGEAAFNSVKTRLGNFLQQWLCEADALLWMETESTSLFLIPPRAANVRVAVEAVLKMILNTRLIGVERLGLSVPVEFTCALHYGQTIFQAPGETGSVVSESVNYIFHLGAKRAETGRLTMSGYVPEEAVPEGLQGLFSSSSTFEGIPVRHSRRFIYE